MKLNKSLLCAALLVGVSSVAIADFSGFYAGPQVSYGWVNSGLQASADNILISTGKAASISPDGLTVGPHVGWAFQQNQWVYAIEASYDGGSRTDYQQQATSVFSTGSFSTQLSQLYTITPVLGYAVEDWMLYGKAGYISGKVQIDSSASNNGYDESLSDSQRQDGWTAGAGVAYKITETSSLGLEYDYARFSSTEFNTTATGTASIAETITVQPIHLNTISLVYSHYF